MATPRDTITGWDGHWADAGGLYVLTYRTPQRTLCDADARVYDKVQSARGITGIKRGLATPSDTPSRGFARYWQPPERYELLECHVIITQPGTLGRRLQPRILPCDGTTATYELAKVQRVRADTGAILRSLARVKDAMESPGEAVGDAFAAGISAVASQLFDALLPLAIPLALAFIVYRSVTR